TATTIRHFAMPRSSGWYKPWPPCSARRSRPATPRSAAPYCTYVGTSAARTTSRRRSGRCVARMSLREVSGSSVARTPAFPRSGRVSSKMRPLARASVIMGSGYPRDARAQEAQPALDVLVAAIEVVDAVDHGFPIGHEAGDHEARGGAQVGGHHRGAGKRV